MITAVEEVSVWAVDRYRPRMFPINLFSTLAPNILAAYGMLALDGNGLAYYTVLAGVAVGAIALNFFLVTALVGLFYGESIIDRYARHRRLIGPIAVNVAVAVAAVALYRSAGVGAIVFVVVGVLIFAYVTKRVSLEREHLARISELAAGRGRLVAQLLEAEDRERRALAEVLHDDVIQMLLVVRQDLSEPLPQEDLTAAITRLDAAVASLRTTIMATHPSVLERVGLATALSTVAELYGSHGGYTTTVQVSGTASAAHDRLIFSAARELLANVAKHADAETAEVRVWAEDDWTYLYVRDDGIGFDSTVISDRLAVGHIGLQALRERVESVGGRIDFRTADGVGTIVSIRVPKVRDPGHPSVTQLDRTLPLASVSED